MWHDRTLKYIIINSLEYILHCDNIIVFLYCPVQRERILGELNEKIKGEIPATVNHYYIEHYIRIRVMIILSLHVKHR